MAREADPAGIRTVGVITKCNLVQLVSKPEVGFNQVDLVSDVANITSRS